MSRAVLVLELNELCPPLIEQFIASGDLPTFARLRDESMVYVTEAEEEEHRLNPWIQWVTAHTGVGFDQHGIHTLGTGDSSEQLTVADVVTEAGRDVWLCAPMNVVPRRPVRGWWLPDPWNSRQAPTPAHLQHFATFVRSNVQEHTNAARGVPAGSASRFLAYMARHGLRPQTALASARQLVGERLGQTQRWKRAALLDRLQWDLFRHHHARSRPAFATYFSNTTAHYQHQYWRHMDPTAFSVRPSVSERARFGEAIRFGYQEMDRLIASAIELVGDHTTLVLCTAISQQPYVEEEEQGGSYFHRPHDMAGLVERLGIRGISSIAPVMAAQFHLYFASEPDAVDAEVTLRAAAVAERPAFSVRREGTDVFTECAIYDQVPEGAHLTAPDVGSIPFAEWFYRADVSRSGGHHRAGAFWIRTPDRRGSRIDEHVSLRSVAPTLLDLLDLPAPASMDAPALATDLRALSG